ncbi:MAG TPA: hypothetical protein VLX29_11000, partial [Nitrospirota bacterium]|nr:hypothetical protein [Nitrospirota bacterium]
MLERRSDNLIHGIAGMFSAEGTIVTAKRSIFYLLGAHYMGAPSYVHYSLSFQGVELESKRFA